MSQASEMKTVVRCVTAGAGRRFSLLGEFRGSEQPWEKAVTVDSFEGTHSTSASTQTTLHRRHMPVRFVVTAI